MLVIELLSSTAHSVEPVVSWSVLPLTLPWSTSASARPGMSPLPSRSQGPRWSEPAGPRRRRAAVDNKVMNVVDTEMTGLANPGAIGTRAEGLVAGPASPPRHEDAPFLYRASRVHRMRRTLHCDKSSR